MNLSEFSLYGMCPFYDDTILVKCNLCELIVKLSQLNEHLSKRHGINEPEHVAGPSTKCQQTEAKLKSVVEKIKTKLNTTNIKLEPSTISTTNLNQTSSDSLLNNIENNSNKNLKISTNLANKTSRVYDPDKHCGVLTEYIDESGNKMVKDRCMRSLTCKKHSISLRRQVQGRSKPFNELFKEYRKEKPVLNSSPTQRTKHTRTKQEAKTTTPEIDQPRPELSVLNTQTNEGNKILNRLYLNNLSLQVVKHHPRPSAVTSFNARLTDNGGGYTLWNRKQDNLRYILANSLFKNDLLLKKNNNSFLLDNKPQSVLSLNKKSPEKVISLNETESNGSKRSSFHLTGLIKSSSISQCDTIHKLNDYLLDGDIFQNDDEDEDDQSDNDLYNASKYLKTASNEEKKVNNSEQIKNGLKSGSIMSPSPSSSSSASSSSSLSNNSSSVLVFNKLDQTPALKQVF